MIKFFEPPFLLNAENSIIEDKIKSFSSNFFSNKIFGYISAIQFNIYIFICFLKNKNLINIFFEYLVFYLLYYIIQEKLFKKKK